ncbi:MAG: hypothetical protein LOD91_05865, partial [Limnochordales bacterium]
MAKGGAVAPARSAERWAGVGLLLIAIVWGGTFPVVKDLVERVPPHALVASRFALAWLVLAGWALGAGRLERMRLAVLFQMTYPGMPMIYYGDEVGMTGGTDPDCRRPMVWEEEKQNRELLSFYRRLISLRKELRPLRRGDFRTWLVD